MSLQEAVADRVHCCTASCNPSLCHPSLGLRARILQSIRLLSLLHGKPEAIPVVDQRPHFATTNPEHGAPHAHVSWSCDSSDSQHPIVKLTERIEKNGSFVNFKESGLVHLVEPGDALAALRGLKKLKKSPQFQGPCEEIEQLLRAAAKDGEAVLMRERKEYGNDDLLEGLEELAYYAASGGLDRYPDYKAVYGDVGYLDYLDYY
jgi:hypothetical protein